MLNSDELIRTTVYLYRRVVVYTDVVITGFDCKTVLSQMIWLTRKLKVLCSTCLQAAALHCVHVRGAAGSKAS